MKAIISNYRMGRHVPKQNHLVLVISGSTSREKAQKYIGKEVVWASSAGKKITGKISAAHGNKGAVRAVFPKGLPGQCRGGMIEIV